MYTEKKQERFSVKYQKFVYGALLAFIIVMIPVLASIPKLDLYLLGAAICFGISAPLLTLSLTMLHFKSNTPPDINHDWYIRWKKYLPNVTKFSLGCSLIGIELFFLHINLLVGLFYTLSAGISIYILYKCVPMK